MPTRLAALSFVVMSRVVAIHVAPEGGAPVLAAPAVVAEAGKGLEGDRYARRIGTFSKKDRPARQVTLVESEALEAAARDYGVALDPGASRRNITTEGVALNHLVGREFRVGEATLRGIQLCEPCGHMERLSGRPGAKAALIHRGGLNAEVLEGGTIKLGDTITVMGREVDVKKKSKTSRKSKTAGKTKKPAGPKPPGRKGGPAPVPPGQKPFERAISPKNPPRVEEGKGERPRPGRFHPGRGDLGGRG